jgi:hypothetical protein
MNLIKRILKAFRKKKPEIIMFDDWKGNPSFIMPKK